MRPEETKIYMKTRVNKIKRVSNNSIFTKSLKPEMIDDNVRKYISSIDKDNRSNINVDSISRRTP